MRSLHRNQQPVFFKQYLGQEEILDEYGNLSGSYIPIYSTLKSAMLCVSPNKGSSEVDQFGTFADYDRTMTTADANCPIVESSILWIDGAETSGPHNAIVKFRGPWKNSVAYAIKMVKVSEYQEQQRQIEQAEQLKLNGSKVRINAENQV